MRPNTSVTTPLAVGYHASHEQFPPSDLLRYVRAAEDAGFDEAMCSDHFAPWSERQGESGFAWAWLGAAMQATSLPFGVVCAPGWRYHPAIVAQAAATLAEMFPNRFWVTLGTGQLLSEHIIGSYWPSKAERNARLQECVEVIRALWAGETVDHQGRIEVHETKLYTRPSRPPAIMGAALTPETAAWVGSWADGLITINQPAARLKALVDAFRLGGGASKPMYLQVHLSYAATEEAARRSAYDQWRTNTLSAGASEEIKTPALFDAATQWVRPEDMDESVHISAELNQHIEWLQSYAEMGFTKLFLHNVGRNQTEFVDAFGVSVLPALKAS